MVGHIDVIGPQTIAVSTPARRSTAIEGAMIAQTFGECDYKCCPFNLCSCSTSVSCLKNDYREKNR